VVDGDGHPRLHLANGLRRTLQPRPDAQAVPPEAHESLGSRKIVAEVPLTGLSFFSLGTDLASPSLALTYVALPALVGMAGFAGLADLARGSRRRTAQRGGPSIDVEPQPDTVFAMPAGAESQRRRVAMNRRRFVSAAGLGLPAILSWPQSALAAGKKKRVIVVGAGVSGLSAAKTLAGYGHNVVVLEARTRIGGRIATSSLWADTPIDLGAAWIHGSAGNPITTIAQAIRAPMATTLSDSQIIYGNNGRALDATDASHLESLRVGIQRTVAKAQNTLQTDISLQAAIEAGMQWPLRSAADQVAMRYVINSDYEQEYGGRSSALSAMWFDSDGEFSGDDLLFVTGYKAVSDFLARGLNIRLGEVVRRIRVQGGVVYVNTQSRTFTADKVLVTLPLGVLKAGAIEFIPRLPAAKTNAINRLGMGLLNKCILRFNRMFWASTKSSPRTSRAGSSGVTRRSGPCRATSRRNSAAISSAASSASGSAVLSARAAARGLSSRSRARGAGCAHPAMAGTWRRPPPISSITSSRRYPRDSG
jgi:hypothetical protein